MQVFGPCPSLKYLNLAGCGTSISLVDFLEEITRFALLVTQVHLPWLTKGLGESTCSPGARRPLPEGVHTGSSTSAEIRGYRVLVKDEESLQ